MKFIYNGTKSKTETEEIKANTSIIRKKLDDFFSSLFAKFLNANNAELYTYINYNLTYNLTKRSMEKNRNYETK